MRRQRSRHSIHRKRSWAGVSPGLGWLLLSGFVLGTWLGVQWGVLGHATTAKTRPSVQTPYQYEAYRASDGTLLHTMRAHPDDVKLLAIRSNVTDTEEYGINGGFFWNGDLLSIAVMDDLPLKGEPHAYGSGWSNIDKPKGTLVWDKLSRRFSVQIVEAANQLQVTDRRQYWAQGGVSMSLQLGESWHSQAMAEDMPLIDERRLRSAAVYDLDGQLWLVVSDKPHTAGQFRRAIMETVARGRLVDGVFLDGDGSSQMRSEESKLAGDKRYVYQMISLNRHPIDR
ncbi:phosphodiester glycosidase family protein [Paenibacillus puerhi]|uniref:phosphodiester glycosidase family protein n=1 Tax=Paenibacillus puerhi TaxID=2692622 RepID=UPI00135AEFF4|nr:phosphodiester glycosidase family protein [Paenibacillus puerhi]